MPRRTRECSNARSTVQARVRGRSNHTAPNQRALAKGRAQSKAVREYLRMIEQDGRRSSNLSPDHLNAKIHALQAGIEDEADPARRVELIQKRLDLEEQLGTVADVPDPEVLENGFVEVAREYSDRKGLTYWAWREVGVPAATLKAAGISRARHAQ